MTELLTWIQDLSLMFMAIAYDQTAHWSSNGTHITNVDDLPRLDKRLSPKTSRLIPDNCMSKVTS